MFLRFRSDKLDNHFIHSDWQLMSNHALLTVTILTVEEHIQTRKCTIAINSDEEKNFVKKLIDAIKNIGMSSLSNVDCLKKAVQDIIYSVDRTWAKNSKVVDITRYSKSWWDINYSRDLEKYKSTRSLKDCKQFKKIIKYTKQAFFNLKI